MTGPTPRTAVEKGRDIDERVLLLERRLQRAAAIPTDPTPLASETVAGKAQLASIDEAHLWPSDLEPSSNTTSTIMTPQRTMDLLEWFAPKVGMSRNSFYVSDWDDVDEVGFYKSYENALNRPPGPTTSSYVGIVHSMSDAQYNAGGTGYILQDVWEIAYNAGVITVPRKWTRVADNDLPRTWGAWAESGGTADWADITGKPSIFPTDWASVAGKPATFTPSAHTHTSGQITDFATAVDGRVNALVPAASATVSGKVELATSAEVAAGTDNVRAVTPLALLGRTATETRTGLVELATTAEATAGTDTVRAVTPAGLKAAVPAATETVAGKARLATEDEAHLWPPETTPTPDLVSTIMTPQRTMEMLEWYAPAVGMSRTNLLTTDWNLATDAGFYKSYDGALNNPPGLTWSAYIGIVHNGDSAGFNSGGTGSAVQEVFEVDNADPVRIIRKWRRARSYANTWTAWEYEDASTTKAGIVRWATAAEVAGTYIEPSAVTPADVRTVIGLVVVPATATVAGKVELATTAEATTGTDTVRAVTPAGLKAAITASAVTVPAASETVAGKVELATSAEVTAGSDAVRAVTPAGLKVATNLLLSKDALVVGQVVNDWNDALVPGTYYGNGLNAPAGSSVEYVGLVYRTGNFANPTYYIQALTEVTNPSAPARRWTRAIAAGWQDPWILESSPPASVGTAAERAAFVGMTPGFEFYETDTELKWIWNTYWRLLPGQTLAYTQGPGSNAGGAGVIIGSIISTPVLPVGQKIKIMSNFSQFETGTGISTVRTNWRNSATDVAFGTYDGTVVSRGYDPAGSIVTSGRGCAAIYTVLTAAKVTAALYTDTAGSQVYGADGTYLWIESA